MVLPFVLITFFESKNSVKKKVSERTENRINQERIRENNVCNKYLSLRNILRSKLIRWHC